RGKSAPLGCVKRSAGPPAAMTRRWISAASSRGSTGAAMHARSFSCRSVSTKERRSGKRASLMPPGFWARLVPLSTNATLAPDMGPARSALVVAVVVSAVSPASLGCRRSQRLDSVLLITLDTLRADHVSCYGPSPVKTPHLDALALRGARATRAWTPIPLTTPAHASILSGLYPPAHGLRNNGRFRLPDDVTTLAEVLKAGGSRTAAFVAAFPTLGIF